MGVQSELDVDRKLLDEVVLVFSLGVKFTESDQQILIL
jgi:hypothetical protein